MQRISLIVFCLVLTFSSWGQQKKVIEIKQADRGLLQKQAGENINILIGNVILEHEGALMYCDSAVVYQGKNTTRAFGNVKINQGDTLFLYGDRLFYNGETRIADVYDNVTLSDPQITLTTNTLTFDRKINQSYYNTFGKIINNEDVLTSKKGIYNSTTKQFNFKDSVRLVTPRYTITSDTLIYFSEIELSKFRGPTLIFNDSSFIYTERGQHDGLLEVSHFTTNSYIYDAGRLYKGDSLYYENAIGSGKIFGNAYIHDSIENTLIVGDYAEYQQNPDYGLVTGNAIYSMLVEEDSLHIHGDTLLYNRSPTENFDQLQVYYGVKIFKTDFQGKCDSLYYNDLDSIFKLFVRPVLWNENSQMTADTIWISMRNGQMDSLHLLNNAFLLSENPENDDIDQIKGRNMFGIFVDSELDRLYVIGNGQTAYHSRESDGSYIGFNRANCSNMLIRFKNSEISKISFLVKPDGKMYPPKLIPEEEKKLKGFLPRFI